VRILLVTGIYPPDVGGPATFIPRLAQYLCDRGIEVEVLTLADSNFPADHSDWKITRIKRQMWLPIRFIITVLTGVKRLKKCDAVFVNGLHEEIGIALRFLNRQSVAKIVGDPVWERSINAGITELSIEDFNQSRLNLGNRLQRRLLISSLNRFNFVISPSQGLVDIVKAWGVRANTSLLLNGIENLGDSKPEINFDLVTVSRLVKWKQVDAVIRSASILNLSICIVGNGPENEALIKLAKELGCKATFVGNVSENEAIELIKQSEIYILFSTYEGLSFSLLQAMTLGKTVVVSNAQGNVDVVTNNYDGLIVNKSDQNALTETLKVLTSNPGLKTSLGLAARKTALDKYSLVQTLSATSAMLGAPRE
jgi:glycosyltransferase involved in cell wall biosynthesis